MHLETDLLPTASRSYKSPETLAPAMLCKLAGMLVERRAELGMVQDKRGEALIPALLSMVQGGHSDTDLQQAKLPLLSQALMWENQIMGTSGVAQSVEPVSGGIRVQPMRSVRRNDTAGTPSPRKTQPSEESDSEGSESSEEGSDQADHVYDSLKQVGFNSEDGSPMVEVGWADGTDSWQPEETLCLQGDSGEILAELWRAAGLGKKSKVVITPPGEPILCHTSRGRWRDHLPFAQKMSSKENHFRPPPKDMSSRLGTLLFRWSKLSSSEMPGWSLNEKKLTEALISQIIVGYRALDEETPGFEVMQTMFPFEATFLSLADAKKLTEVGSLKDCFVHHEKNPSQNMFRIANPEGQKIYSLMDSASWPRVAVNKELRSLLPSSVFSPEGSPSEEEELLSQLQDELQDVSLKARSFDPSLNRNEQRDPSQLADILNVLVPGCNPGSSVLSACRDEIADRQKRLETLRVAVLCSNENSTMPDKKRGPYLAPIPEMGTGGEFLNPATGSPDYNSRTTLAERLADLEKVPNYDRQEESNTGDPGSRLCISCNEVTLTEHINSLPAQPKGGSYKNCFNFGPWTPELRKKLQLDNSGRWFCQNCPVGPEGSPTLLPAPGSIWNCPGRGCGAVHQNPCDGVMRTCPSCNTPYGLGNVLPKNLKPQCESKSREVQMREAEEQRLAYVLGSGGHETKRLRTIKGPFEMQTWLAQGAVIHSSIPGLPAVEVGLRHVKGFSGCFFSATGAHGLNVVDFQARYGKIPPLEVSVDAFRDKAIKAKWGDTDMRPPVWAGQGALTQDQRIGLLEQAYSHMADFFVFVYGPNFRPDMVTARAAYEHFIQLDPDNWSADRREALINSIFSDYSRRVAAQQQDWSMDQRVAWEREGWLTKPQLPGQVFAIRPLCFYSKDFIKAVMEPYDNKMRELLSDTQFGKKGPTRTVKSVSQEEQEDSFPINHKSGAKAEDKEGSEKQISTMLKQLQSKDEEIAKLKKAEETHKEEKRKADEKRASAKTGSTEASTSERVKVKIPEPRPRGGKGKGSQVGEVLKITGMGTYLKSHQTTVRNSRSPVVQIPEVTQAYKRVGQINDPLRTAAQGSPGEARGNSRKASQRPLPETVAASQVSFHSTGGGYPEGGKSQPLKATGSERLKSDGVEPPSDIGAKPVEEKSDKKGSGRSVNTRGSMAEESEVRTCSECTKLWVANPDDQATVCADCRWVKSTIHARRPTNSAGWAVLYQEKVRGDGESRPKDLEAQGDFTNEWYCFELGIRSNAKSHSTLHFTSKDCSKALQRMVSALRTLWFKDRASEGPTMQDIEDFFREKLPTGHMEFLKEIITKGGDPVHSGHRTGYQGRMNGNESPEDEEVVRAEYADLVAAGRGLTFNLNNKAVLELLVRGGVRFAPTFVIDKKLPDGTVHPTKKRIITDCTNRGHVKAVNTGIGSEAQSTQKTTNTPRVIAGALKEEKDFPHSALGGIKLDVASAFSQIGLTLESVGLMASCLPCGVSIVYLVNPFGARSSPGIFEVPGDAIVKAVWMTPRIDPRLTGADHPDSARFVDDVMSVVAHHGDRAEDHKSRLVGIIQKLFGPEGINLEKQGLEGTMENFKYAFGALLDLQKREVKVPGAKLKKAFDLAEEFLTQRCKAFSCGVAQKLRGVLGSITCWCPPMSALVLPRLDAIASNAAKAHPQVPTPPPDFIASPAFSDEQGSESDAWESLRLCLDFFFRLASIRDGALMRVSFEGGLPLLDRLTFPGKETKEYHSHVVSDAARGAVAGFDMQNGLYYTHLLSEGEQEVFNSWDTLDKNEQVSINQLENLANLFSALLLCPHHPGGIQCLVQDNTASENMQLKRTHRTRKDEQIGAVMALVSLIFSTHLYGARVNTEDNPADFFTRSKLSSEAEKFLVDFEVKTGIKPVKVDIPDWMSSMGWVRPEAGQTRFQYWYDQSLKAIDYIIEHHRPTVDRFCPVPIEEIRQMLLETLDGAPLRKIEFVRDFPPHSGPSVQRTALLDQTPKASPSLQSTWKKAEMSAGDELEKRMLEEKSLLSVVNPGYQTEVDFPLPSPAKLSKNWFQELMAKSKESAVGHNSHYKPSRRVKLATCFSGLGVFEQAATDTGLVEVVLFIEHNPNLYRRLTEIHPRAAALRETAECLEKEGRMGQAVMLCTSLPSETHTNSFQPMSDLSDPLCKGDLETAIAIIQAQQLVIAAIVCRPELWQRLCNSPTEMASFQGSLTGYEVQASILEEAEVVSPLTGERSHEFRKSCVLVVFNKKHFAFIPDSSLFSKRSDPPDQFMNLLDIKGEFFPSFRQMPHSDLIDFVYKFQIASGHPAWVGTIHDAPDDSSEGRYPSRCMAPNLSALSSYTASGGGPWIAVSCPSTAPTAYPQVQAGMRRLEPEEVARVKGLRGLDNKRDRVFMRENFTASQQAVGNSPAQPFCDLIIVQLLLHLHSNQGSGPSALERWEVYQTRAEATWSSSEAEEAVIREERSLRLKTGMAVTLQPKEGPPARVNFARRTGKTDREEQEEREEVKRKYVGWEKLEPHEVTPSSERADDEKRAQNVKKRCKEETKISNTQREARSRDRPTKGRWVRRGRKKGEVSLGLKTGSTRMLQEVQTDRPTQELISQPVSRPLTNDAGSVSAAYVPVVGTDTCIFFYPAEGEQELGSECTMIIRTVQFEKEKNLEVQKQVLTHPNSVKSAFQKFVTGKFLGKDIRFNADQADKLAQLDKRYHNDGLDPQGLSGSWRMRRNDLLQVQLPAWMVDADLIFIRSTKQQGGRISVQFSSAPLVVHASAELGQIYKRLHCTGCHEYSDFHRESKFCEVCTPILVTWIQEEALKGTEWTQLKMKECLPILLGRAGKHAGMRWPSIRVQLIDNNRGYLENTPLRLGVNLPGNVSLFLRMIPTLESLFMDHLKENQLDGSILVHWSNQLPCGQRDGDRENKELERIHAQKARARSSAPVYGEAGKNSEESLASIFTISYSFLHWANKEPKSIPKLPASPALLEFIVLSLDRSTWPGAALEACMCLMFGVLLRGKECLSESESHADSDKVVRWKDLILRENLKLSTECCTNDNYGEGKMLTMKVRSGKNGLGTCTRTITKTENCAICAVSAIQNLHKVILDLTGAFPDPEEALCRVGESSWLSGRQISGVLKAGMTACRCRSDTTASFSLRRGGATAYYCAGVPIEDIRIFGRWLSDAYKLYIFLSDSSTIMSKGNVHPTTMVPRFEEN